MLRLALCGLSKSAVVYQGCAASWQQIQAVAALSAKQQPSVLSSRPRDLPQQQQQQPGVQPYSSQDAPPPKQPPAQQPQQQQHKQPAGAASSSDGSSAGSNGGPGPSSPPPSSPRLGGGGGSSNASGADSTTTSTTTQPPAKRKSVYTGGSTAAQHNRRASAAALSAQQLEGPLGPTNKPAPPPPQQQLSWQGQEQLQPLPASRSSTVSSSGSGGSLQQQSGGQPPLPPLDEQQQYRQMEYKPRTSSSPSQQQQRQDHQQQPVSGWQSPEANYQQTPPQQQHYKVVQYSRGTSLLLALSAQPSGDYALQKHKGPASAADIAAFGRSKPPKDGNAGNTAAAAAPEKHLREFPLLLRPFLQYYRHLKKVLVATFLPSGYPASVGSNYLEYTLWQAVTNFATTANGVLASTFMLYSVGLGAGAIPTAGALNWVLKDGLGQMGTLLFGKAIAHNFDIHSKTWYFMSFLLLGTATGLEIATILVPEAFLALGSCANMIKGLSWMAGGSTRSVFNLSFVRDNNIADITAKNTSQYIFASLFGTAAGVSCCAFIGQSAPLALMCFSGLAYTSMYSAYRTVKSIPLPTLNSTRLQLLAARYLKCVRTTASDGFPGVLSFQRQQGFLSYQQEYEVPEDEDDTCELELPSPLDMAELDNPLPWVYGDPRLLNPGIHVGSQLDRLVEGQPAMLVVVLNTFRYSRYLLVPERNAIHLVLHAEAQPRDMVQAYLQACILRKCLKTGHSLSPDNLPELRIILHDTLLAAENLTPPFMRALARQGWQTEKIVVEAHRRRARW